MPAPYIKHTRTARRIVVIKFNCFVYDSYLAIRLLRVLKCVTSEDVGSGVA